ncbi:MAG: hypothetical protein ACE5NC_10215 [Anaerolineae bacterium]
MDPEAVAAWRDLALVCLAIIPCLTILVAGAVVLVAARGIRSARIGLRPRLQTAASTASQVEARAKRVGSVLLSPYFLAVRLSRTITAWLGR